MWVAQEGFTVSSENPSIVYTQSAVLPNAVPLELSVALPS